MLALLRYDLWNRNMVICTASTLFYYRFACCQVWALLLVLGLLIPAQAAEVPGPDPLPQIKATLDRLETQLASGDTATQQELEASKEELSTIRPDVLDCVEQAEKSIARLESELAILRPGKPADATAKDAPRDATPRGG